MENIGNRVRRRDRRRAWVDSLTRRIVAGSGLLVLLALLSIFFYLLYVATPIFLSPSASEQHTAALDTTSPALAIGIDDGGRMGFRIDRQGYGEFIALPSGRTTQRIQLASSADLLAQSLGERQVYVFGQSDGRIRIAQPWLPPGDPLGAQWLFPFGEKPLSLGLPAQPLRQLAVAAIAEKRLIVAAVTQDYRLLVSEVGEGGIRRKALIELPEKAAQQLLITPDGRQIFLLNGTQLSVWQSDAKLTLREKRRLAEQGALHLTLLPGGRSLLVQSDSDGGRIAQWFDVPTENGMRLTEIRRFPLLAEASALLASETRRRVFAVLTPQGELSLFASKRSGALLTRMVAPDAQALAFSPHGRALLIETAGGWRTYQVDNPYPDIGWRGLWRKLWYEDYPEPAYIWQPTSADDVYQAKFSMAPLILGTLKAAIYAMFFAAPLALSAAIYTACFMSPALRRWVKPALEIMGALPTVVVGLIAAIWLAPHFAVYLSAILAMPLLWTLAVLGCGWLVNCLPAERRRLFSDGWAALFLLPVILLTLMAGCRLGPIVEMRLLGQPLYQWLGDDFAQRNALVAGVALGFALVPLIFLLAEEALFSVPARLSQGSLALGATPWQTLWRVVLPSAGAGIFAALMLSFGRAVGETMIVLMATGNTPIMDAQLLQGLRSLAANIAIEMPDAVIDGGHYRVLFLTALTLFVFTFVVNTLAESLRRRLRRRYRTEGGPE